MNKKIGALALFLVVLFAAGSLVLAKNDKSEEKSNNSAKLDKEIAKESKDDKASPSAVKTQEKMKTNNSGEDKSLKNSNMEMTNSMDESQVKKDKAEKIEKTSKKVSKTLKEVAMEEEEIAEELEELAEEQEETQDEIADSVKGIQKQNKVKTFLLGTDYKNLGQLRSSMVQNRNQIRQLIRLIDQTEDGENKTVLQEQLATMTQEREQIHTMITENEDTFSLFGWVFRSINGYEKQDSDDEAEEEELQDEVEEALEDYDENEDQGMMDEEDGMEDEEEGEMEEEELAPVI